jgi:hypothetical protein
MADTPASNVDTEGAYGHAGSVPVGEAATSGYLQPDGTVGTTDTEGTAPGGAENTPPPPATEVDTSGTNGTNLPSNFHPVDVSMTGNPDTVSSDGSVIRQANPAYRAPAAYVAGGTVDTTHTDTLGVGPAPDDTQSLYTGNQDSGNIGAGTTAKIVTENLTLDTTGHVLSKAGVLPAGAVTVVNKGQIIAVTGESHVLSGLAAFTVTHSGVTDLPAAVVVKKGTTTLVQGTDYSITATGSAGTANYSITPIDSVNVDSGDTLLVSYHYGNAKYFANATLTTTTDYTKTYSGEGAGTTLKITRVNTAASSDGDTVAVTYSYGDSAYWGSNIPATRPGIPTIGTVVAENLAVKVNWTAPSGNVDITSYIVQCVPGYGTKYVAANALSTDFTQVQAGVAYKFRVAAMNARGESAYSELSAAVIPRNDYANPVYKVVDESHTLSGLAAFAVTHKGVLGDHTAVTLKKGATPLVETTDYTIAFTSAGSQRVATITPVDSATVNSGDTLLVSYSYATTSPLNTVNPIYNLDGTVKAGTGLGPS